MAAECAARLAGRTSGSRHERERARYPQRQDPAELLLATGVSGEAMRDRDGRPGRAAAHRLGARPAVARCSRSPLAGGQRAGGESGWW